MAATANVNVTSERNPRKREPDDRAQPFLSVLLTGLIVVPAFGVFLRFVIFWSPEVKSLIGWCCVVTGFALATFSFAMNARIAKRDILVAWHYVITWAAFGTALYTTINVRWPEQSAPWSHRLLAVVDWPSWWVVIHLFGSLIVSCSWLIYRFDNLRASNGEDGDRGKLAELLGMPAGAKIRPGTIEADEYGVTATIDHPTVPADHVAKALPAMVEYAGAVRGRSTMIPNERGGSSTVRIVKNDPLKDWRLWPGLSHPGLSFAYPFRSSYYTTGPAQWYSFAMTPPGLPPSAVAPKFRSGNDAHLGRQGATRAGKSGDIAIEIAEALSRRDCIVCVVNAAKLMQDSAWCLDMVGLAADTPKRAQFLFAGLRALGEYRSDVMGDPRLGGRHRTWTPATYEELGFAAVLVEVDEGDVVLSGTDVTWLSTKGLSLGVYCSVSISRAVTDGMASTLRSAIPTWKAFGAGQDYDKGFALSVETMKAGAEPETFGTRFPGAHYLDKAQGVEDKLYPVAARSYQTSRDFSDLRRAVEKARATFTPPAFTPGEVKALGEAWRFCQPRTVLIGAMGRADSNTDTGGASAPPADQLEGQDMTKTLDMGHPDTGDPALDNLMSKPREDFSAFEREHGALPPVNQPMPLLSDPNQPGGTLVDDKPRVSREETVAEFDAALIRLAERDVTRFTNQDVMKEMRVMAPPSWTTRHFQALCDEGKAVTPPGLAVERIEGKSGQYLLTRLGPPPGTDGA